MGGRGAYMRGSGGGNSTPNAYSITYESENGGAVYTEESRIKQAKINKQEKAKYEKEHDMCKHLANNGHTVVHLDDRKLSNGSYDILLDGKKAELKSLKGLSNIGREGKRAINKQGAEIVVFKFEKFSEKAAKEIVKLQNAKIHGYYYISGDKGLVWF